MYKGGALLGGDKNVEEVRKEVDEEQEPTGLTVNEESEDDDEEEEGDLPDLWSVTCEDLPDLWLEKINLTSNIVKYCIMVVI